MKKIHSAYIFPLIAVLVFLCGHHVGAEETYTATDLFTIPWGNEPGYLPSDWLDPDEQAHRGMLDPPGPWAVSSAGLVIAGRIDRRLSTFLLDGSLVASIELNSDDLPYYVTGIAISDEGLILLDSSPTRNSRQWYLLDMELNVIATGLFGGASTGMFESNEDSFWVLTSSSVDPSGVYDMQMTTRYILNVQSDGTMSEPLALATAQSTDPVFNEIRFVTPSGEIRPSIEDMYGNTYQRDRVDGVRSLVKQSLEGVVLYTHSILSDPGWLAFTRDDYYMNHRVTWEGEIYTLRATNAGAVLTRYTLE